MVYGIYNFSILLSTMLLFITVQILSKFVSRISLHNLLLELFSMLGENLFNTQS